MKRKAAVAGFFYPSGARALREVIERMVDGDSIKRDALSVVAPHAGFEYSGFVAGAVYSSVNLPDKFVIFGPSHRYVQSRFAIMNEGVWETPLGAVPIAAELARAIMHYSTLVSIDSQAHAREHSLEVQIPFIQFFKKDISFVPISISYDASFDELEELGASVASAIKQAGEEVLIVASTDMSHYVEQEVARKKDFIAIDRILHLDAKGLYDVVGAESISMCGYQPTTAAIVASVKLGAKKGELIKYQTSGDVTGDYREVVGYAGIRIS